MATLFLVRHGQASYGETDYDRLSRRGQDQARAVGEYLAGLRLDATFAGPLRRQQQTIQHAVEAAADQGVALPPPMTVDELAEYPAFEMLKHLMPRLVAEDQRFATLETAPTPRLLDEAFHTILRKWSHDEWAADSVERVGAFVERVKAGLDRVIRSVGSGARIACVTSAGPIGVAVGLTFGIPAERMVRTSIVIRNASITELRFRTRDFAWEAEQLSLVTFNLTTHLPLDLQTER